MKLTVREAALFVVAYTRTLKSMGSHLERTHNWAETDATSLAATVLLRDSQYLRRLGVPGLEDPAFAGCLKEVEALMQMSNAAWDAAEQEGSGTASPDELC